MGMFVENESLKKEFQARLFVKTGWGCKQVWVAFLDAISAAKAREFPEMTAEEEEKYRRARVQNSEDS